MSDPFIDRDMLEPIEQIVQLVLSTTRWSRDPREFLFRTLKNYFSASTFDVADLYKSGRPRKIDQLNEEEIVLCSLIQRLRDTCLTPDRFDKVIGTIFEKYVFATEKSIYEPNVYCNAQVRIKDMWMPGTIDFLVDRLQSHRYLELSEATINMVAYRTRSKQNEVQLYAKTCEEIRREVGDSIEMKLELLASAVSN